MRKILTIEGMACKTCVQYVQSALSNVNGVEKVKVNLKENSATLKVSDTVTDDELIAVVERAGYSVNKIIYCTPYLSKLVDTTIKYEYNKI
jgi:copper chaperone CopZ